MSSQLAFDGQQRGALIASGATRSPSTCHRPRGKQVLLEHDADAVQVVLGRHVEHGVVFVVEAAVLVGLARASPCDQVLVEVPVRADVAHRVHRHEARVLQEAGIDAAAVAGVAGRHLVNQVASRTSERLAGGEVG